MEYEDFKTRFGPALAWAQHQDKKNSWPWYGQLIHFLFCSWRCPACKLKF